MESAIVTISMEIELAWGIIDQLDERKHQFSNNRKKETETLDKLLALCDELELPISFDVVGHLLQEKCNGKHPSPHPDSWFEKDPGTNVNDNPLFYAPDLVDSIQQSNTAHEICTHSFSHVFQAEANSKVFDWEFEQVEKQHNEFGLNKPISFVSPRHQASFKDILKKHDIGIIRTPFPNYESPDYGAFRKFFTLLNPPHPLKKAEVVDGIVETYCRPDPSLAASSLPQGQRSPHKVFSLLPLPLKQYIHKKNLMRHVHNAINESSQLHLWTHLMNISNEAQWGAISKFLTELSELRESNQLTIKTMAELVPYVKGGSNVR